jgi:hypothetical protein
MLARPVSRSRIILAVLVPFVLLALVGLGLAASQGYKLLRWDRAEAVYVGSESLMRVSGNSTEHNYAERHYQFTRKDGSPVLLEFGERESGASPEKSMAVLYDPSVDTRISREEGSRWDRVSNVRLLFGIGLGMAAAGLLPCLVGAVLLIREWRRVPDQPQPQS